MSYQLQHGHIGNKEIEEAIKIFKKNYISDITNEIIYDNKNIYIKRISSYVKGQDND